MTIKGVGKIEKEIVNEVGENKEEEKSVVEEDVVMRKGGSVLGEREMDASALVEEEGVLQGGSASQEEMLSLNGIKGNRSQLVKATLEDETLSVARGLAKRMKEGY